MQRTSRRYSREFTILFAASICCATQADDTASVSALPDDVFVVESELLAEARTINVKLPVSYVSTAAEGIAFPVLYMPDGGVDEDFLHVVATVDTLIREGSIRPVIVVGIPNTQRRRDLTGPTTVASDLTIAPKVGGSSLFRQFVKEELLPEINRRYRTTSERALIGESLAGLFVVETLFEEPSLFTHYIAFDPSLWWNHGALVDSASSWLGALDVSDRTLYLASSGDDIDARVTQLAAVLQKAPPTGLRLRFDPRPDLTHANIFRSLKKVALVDALR